MEQFKFILGSILFAPIMPIVLTQGNKIRRTFPRLPEAKGPEGITGEGKPFKLICLGESSMACVGIDTHENGFAGNFSKSLAPLIKRTIDWKVYAKSGLTAEMVRKDLVPKVEEDQADLILIALGGNDTFQLNSPDKWAKEVELLIKDLRTRFPETPILFSTMPPIHTFPAFTGPIQLVLGQLVSLHGQRLNRLIKGHQNVYFDPQRISLDYWLKKYPGHQKSEFYSDGVHPSTLTYEIWGKELADLVYQQRFGVE